MQMTDRDIYTVSKLTKKIKSLLEENFSFVWVTGEISNYSVPASGHSYFSLKDSNALINCVMFKNQKFHLKFDLENGIRIFGLARLSLYEPRGSYQLIFEHVEPEGAGAAQIAFEQLKKRLAEKGYFDEKHKKKLPFLPLTVCVVTSGTGAAVRDIINVSRRRLPVCSLEIYPVKVQGEGSDLEICHAIEMINKNRPSELIILARGGGSLEDLAAFNSEIVASAIFESDIPIVTGIGHETDFTIADFVADVRAPTPSAAAEISLPDRDSLIYEMDKLTHRLDNNMKNRLRECRRRTDDLRSRLKTPQVMLYDKRLRLEDYQMRLNSRILQNIKNKKMKIQHLAESLDRLNPEKILKRGYSITRFPDNKAIVRDSEQVKAGDYIETILFKGKLIAKVKKR